ncbi:hypothetical protein D3G84_22730 [Escherichia coli]|nr:hypothetical protein [Escherichia coli]
MSKYGKQQICTLRSFFICNTFCFMLCVGIIFINIFTDEINPPIRLTVAALRMHNTSEVARDFSPARSLTPQVRKL